MRIQGVKIIGTGSYVPVGTIATEALCGNLGSSAEWVENVVGCKVRHVAAANESTADLAANAVCRALDAARLSPQSIDVLIVATTTPNRAIPSTAALVQERLGVRFGAAFDVNATCGGFVYGLTCAAALLHSGCSRTAVVVGAETFSRIVDYQQRDCVFFGDAAGAVVAIRSDSSDDWLAADIGGGGENRLAVTVPVGGSELPATENTIRDRQHYLKMVGTQVTASACTHFPPFLKTFLEEHALDLDDIDHLILHQGSRHLLGKVAAELGIPFSRVPTNLGNHGNTAAASVPLLLDQELRAGRIRRGDRVLMAAFGAGWVWGASVVRWAY